MVKWLSSGNDIVVKNLSYFDAEQTFTCGQCFRWNQNSDGNWSGVVKGTAVQIQWDGKDLVFENTSEEVFHNIWYPYFDLDRDYGEVTSRLGQNDPVMRKAIAFGNGIRLLKQDFNEMLISFIISQNNGIPRIKKIIESIAEHFGEPVLHTGIQYHAFPTIEKLAQLTDEDFKVIKAGYRNPYILKSALQIAQKLVEYCRLEECDTLSARKEMLKLTGVGPKVADCILLFSGLKYDVFPVDRWVRRVMAELYLGYEASYDELIAFSKERFGALAGFAQQYLFFYAREMKIGIE